jgi:hypothetical protein
MQAGHKHTQPLTDEGAPGAPPTSHEAERPFPYRAAAVCNVIRWAVFLIPAGLLGFIVWAIWTRTAQVPIWDEWVTVGLVQRVEHGTATLDDFLAFHGEHRIIIPRLVDVPLILATHWNRQVEMTFDLAVAIGEAALLFAALRRSLRSTSLLLALVAPLALLLFSFAQYDDWLWSFQITLTATVLGVALCVWALGARCITWRWLGLGILGALVAALSSLGGAVAFIAFALVVFVRAGVRKTVVWIGCALAVLIPYFQGFPHSVTQPRVTTMAKFVLMFVGAPLESESPSGALMAGAFGMILLVTSLALYLYLHRSIKGVEEWLGLGLFVLGVGTMISFGRDLSSATTSRYQVFSVLWWVMLITLMTLNLRDGFVVSHLAAHGRRTPVHWMLAGATATVVLLMTIALTHMNAISVGQMEDAKYIGQQNQACVVNYAYATPACLQLFYPNPDIVRQEAPFLKEARLGIFSGDTSSLTWPAPAYPPSLPLTPYYDTYTQSWWTTVSYTLDERYSYYAYPALGYVYQQQQPGTRALYDCLTADGQHVLSVQADCQGQRMVGVQGWVYSAPPAGISTTALYSCFTGAHGYVGATDAACNGQMLEGVLGYILTTR